jgi:hypothetical protein
MNESQSESIACLPLALSTGDGEVDLELLRAIPKPFSVTDRESANWLVRKIISAREYAAHVQAWATAEKRRAEREEATLMYLFGRQIESWAMDEVQKLGGRRKSVALPAGSPQTRNRQRRCCFGMGKKESFRCNSNSGEAHEVSPKRPLHLHR